MATGLYEAIFRLTDIGALDIILPFLLFFTVLFAVLQKTQILGEGKAGRKFNIIISLVIALLIIIPHVIYGGQSGDISDGKLGGSLAGFPDVVEIVNNSLPSIAVWIVAILMLFLLMGIGIGQTDFKSPDWLKWTFLVIAVVIVGYIFGSSAGFFQNLPQPFRFLEDPVNQATLLILLVFGLIIFFIVSGGDENPHPKPPQQQPPGRP